MSSIGFFNQYSPKKTHHPFLNFCLKSTPHSIRFVLLKRKLSSLNPNKTPGSDGLHPCLLKNCATSLTRPLFLQHSQSLHIGKIPSDWELADITPAFKKGSKTQANNYRSISLISTLIKMLESMIKAKIIK